MKQASRQAGRMLKAYRQQINPPAPLSLSHLCHTMH